ALVEDAEDVEVAEEVAVAAVVAASASPRGRRLSSLVQLGSFMHACENEMVYKSSNDKVPYFNAGAFLENKTRIGKVDEILGSINEVMFTVKPDAGVLARSLPVPVPVVVPVVDAVVVAVEAVADSLDVEEAAVVSADVVEEALADVEAAAEEALVDVEAVAAEAGVVSVAVVAIRRD
ncbi:hypothetical protein JG688_00013976, partial [Phytophthora aleatoria]